MSSLKSLTSSMLRLIIPSVLKTDSIQIIDPRRNLYIFKHRTGMLQQQAPHWGFRLWRPAGADGRRRIWQSSTTNWGFRKRKKLQYPAGLVDGKLRVPVMTQRMLSPDTGEVWQQQHRARAARLQSCSGRVNAPRWGCVASFGSGPVSAVTHDIIRHPRVGQQCSGKSTVTKN